MPKAYHIVQWNTLYETSNSRKVVTLTYYQKPNKLVGEGIGATLAHPQNVALLGTWSLIEALASTAPNGLRGWLVRGGTALTAARMANLTRVDQQHFARALEHFTQPEIGWLELAECAGLSGESTTNLPQETVKPATVAGLSGESTTNLPQEERRVESEEVRKSREERGALTLAAARASAPSPEEVEQWASTAGVDPVFAVEKLAEGIAREDFAKPAVRKNWRDRFQGFWKSDEQAWRKKRRKTPRAAGHAAERPDDWKPGDASVWWTDSVAEVRVQLGAAIQLNDKKTAARLREILASREKH